MKRKPNEYEALLWVQILEAKPNKMFTEGQRQSVRFLRYNRHVPCVHCGKKRRLHWTMLCDFKCPAMGGFVLTYDGKTHPPLTPVCSDHILAPAVEHKKGKRGKKP